MSVVVPEQKKPWILIAAAIALVLAVTTTILLADLPGARLLSGGGDKTEIPALPELPQARWQMSVHPSGFRAQITDAQKKRVDRQRPKVRVLVKTIYDALFLHPDRLKTTLRDNFTQPAAIALRRSGAGASEAGRVSTTFRRADIGIQAEGGARMAVASVTVRALGERSARPVLHRSSLWLERVRNEWKVVAFDVRQAPLRDKASGAKKKAGGRSG